MSGQVGRPTNQQLIADGKIPVAKRCKVCQSGARDEITKLILEGATARIIIDKFGHVFPDGLTPTNLHSHRQHINMNAAVVADRAKMIAAVPTYNAATKQLFTDAYTAEFDKQAAANALYQQRLSNLFVLQNELIQLNAKDKAEGLTTVEMGLRRNLVQELEYAYKGFNADLIKHIQLDADLYAKQVTLEYIKMVQMSYMRFTEKLMDVFVKEIADAVTRDRVVEQLGDLLDLEVGSVLDPSKAIAASVEVHTTEDTPT